MWQCGIRKELTSVSTYERTLSEARTNTSKCDCDTNTVDSKCPLERCRVVRRPFDKSRYENVVQHCQLGPDLKVLPAGDSTEIGERGITLSGGQKSRVAIARACYDIENTELFLFDDSLSALDVHVGTKIFKHVLTGMLAEKTRILVLSSQYHLLQHADRVVVMEDGECVYCGDPHQAITQYEHLFGKLKFIKEKKGNDDDDDDDEKKVKEEDEEEESTHQNRWINLEYSTRRRIVRLEVWGS